MRAIPAKVEILPAPLDLVLYRGDTFVATFLLKAGGVPLDLSASVIMASVSYPDGRPLQTLETAVVGDGTVQIIMQASTTGAFPIGTAVWDLQVMTGASVRTWVRGRMSVAKDITP